MLLAVLFGVTLSWGPIFHQVIAQEFATEYLPHLTESQKDSLVLGCVYMDGLPKQESHQIEWVLNILRTYENDTEDWWFVMGLALHLAVDVSGHMGNPLSFLPGGRIYHHLSELSVCSSILRYKNPPQIYRNEVSDRFYAKIIGRSSFRFSVLCRLWRKLAGLPVHRYLDTVENDTCKINDPGWGFCNLMMHMRTIKGIMWDSLSAIMTTGLTDEQLGSFARKGLEEIKCCL